MTEFKLSGYMINGSVHVREVDCRRAVKAALKVGKEPLIAALDEAMAMLKEIQDHNYQADLLATQIDGLLTKYAKYGAQP